MRYVHAPLCALALAFGLAATPGAARAQTQSACASPYVMQPGDTLYRVTQQCRVSMSALRDANPQIDTIDSISVGTELAIPGAQTPDPGTDRHEVGKRISMPEETGPNRQVDGVERRDPDAGVGTAPDQPSSGSASTYEGRISRGAECPLLTTPDGDVYSLTGLPDSVSDGDYVEMRATPAEISFCMQGAGTLSVESAHEAPPPARDRDPARAGGVPLTRAYAIGTWAAKGSDCRAPDFAIQGNAAGGQVVHATVAGAQSTGYVRLGDTPAMIFDPPRRELALETRGPDGLAVMPPAEGPVTLSDATIAADGVVFVKCAD